MHSTQLRITAIERSWREHAPRMTRYDVYILRCVDESYYVGVTSNVKMRLEEHLMSFHEGSYVHKRLPAHLVYKKSFRYIGDAIAWEKRIKRWTRAKKEALMSANVQGLHELAECRNESHSKNHSSSFGSAQDDSATTRKGFGVMVSGAEPCTDSKQ